jgi:hypothetical protein
VQEGPRDAFGIYGIRRGALADTVYNLAMDFWTALDVLHTRYIEIDHNAVSNCVRDTSDAGALECTFPPAWTVKPVCGEGRRSLLTHARTHARSHTPARPTLHLPIPCSFPDWGCGAWNTAHHNCFSDMDPGMPEGAWMNFLFQARNPGCHVQSSVCHTTCSTIYLLLQVRTFECATHL